MVGSKIAKSPPHIRAGIPQKEIRTSRESQPRGPVSSFVLFMIFLRPSGWLHYCVRQINFLGGDGVPPCASLSPRFEHHRISDHTERMDGLRLVCLRADVQHCPDHHRFAWFSRQWVDFFFHIVSGSCRISGIPIPLGS
jgi:hypothetical protein